MGRIGLFLWIWLAGATLWAAEPSETSSGAMVVKELNNQALREVITEGIQNLSQAINPNTSEHNQALLQKLSSGDLKGVLIEQERSRVAKERTSALHAIIPMIAVSGFFGTVVVVVISVLIFRSYKENIRHQTIRGVLERGLEVPTELLLPQGRRSDLRRGLVFSLGGLGLVMMFIVTEGVLEGSWGIGLFPMMIGVGYLVHWWLENRGDIDDMGRVKL